MAKLAYRVGALISLKWQDFRGGLRESIIEVLSRSAQFFSVPDLASRPCAVSRLRLFFDLKHSSVVVVVVKILSCPIDQASIVRECLCQVFSASAEITSAKASKQMRFLLPLSRNQFREGAEMLCLKDGAAQLISLALLQLR